MDCEHPICLALCEDPQLNNEDYIECINDALVDHVKCIKECSADSECFQNCFDTLLEDSDECPCFEFIVNVHKTNN